MVKMLKLGPDLSVGAGVGIGTIQLVAIVKYFPGTQWPVFGNIILGGLALVAGIYKYKRGTPHYVLMGYGFTSLFGGLITGIVNTISTPPAAQGMSLEQQAMAYNGYLGGYYYPGVKGTFVMRPQSRARGFASDVTINPMAAIPTEIYYGKKFIA